MRRAVAFALGAVADAALGDPPNGWHPVNLVGQAAAVLRALAPNEESDRARYGIVVAAALPLIAIAGAAIISRSARRLHSAAGIAADAVILDATCALQTLLGRATEVERALMAGDLEGARALCGMHLVSRDTSTLTASEVAAATIESVAENLADGVIAPWLWFACCGAPGAVAYRVANTMDAIWGYRDAEFAMLGRGVARLDDALNLAPARITAAALTLAAFQRADGGRSALRAATTWFRDAGRTDSPNAGHPMSAMAGALGVVLAKPGAYTLGAELREANAEDIGRAIRLARRAAMVTAAGIFGTLIAGGLAP